ASRRFKKSRKDTEVLYGA
ncbi:unnamed protein product, partial [Oikopleura dioica]